MTNRLRRLKELGLVEDTTISENPNIADKKGWRSKNVEKYVREHGELKSHLITDKCEEGILERIEEVEKQTQENRNGRTRTHRILLRSNPLSIASKTT